VGKLLLPYPVISFDQVGLKSSLKPVSSISQGLDETSCQGRDCIPRLIGERELTTGLLSKETSFRVIVNGPVGVREIERLIKKLELDKEILADESEEPTTTAQKEETY
jgi:hypothetical protein